MKILFFINGIYLGGKERRMLELMKELKKDPSISFELVVMNKEINYPEIFDLDIRIHYLIRKTKKDWSVFRKFYILCKQYRPDIIHCWDSMTAVYSIPARLMLKTRLMNGMIVDSPLKQNIFNKNWLRAKMVFRFSDVITANSLAGLHAYNSPAKKSYVIHNGYNFERSRQLLNADEIRNQLAIHTPYVIGMVATFSAFKDYKTYYQAAAIILKKRKDITFLAIGNQTDSIESKLLLGTELQPHFRLLGKRSGIESLVQVMDIGVLATFTEGISNSIMEYMALGKPVIATSGGGTNEIVENEQTGFLVKASDPDELAAKMEILLNDGQLRDQMGNRGKDKVLKSFSIDSMVEKYKYYYSYL